MLNHTKKILTATILAISSQSHAIEDKCSEIYDKTEKSRCYVSIPFQDMRLIVKNKERAMDEKLISINYKIYQNLKAQGVKLESVNYTLTKTNRFRESNGAFKLDRYNPNNSQFAVYKDYGFIRSAFQIKSNIFVDPLGRVKSRNFKSYGYFDDYCKYEIEVLNSSLKYDCQDYADGALDESIESDIISIIKQNPPSD